jgi:hypothetical protein
MSIFISTVSCSENTVTSEICVHINALAQLTYLSGQLFEGDPSDPGRCSPEAHVDHLFM